MNRAPILLVLLAGLAACNPQTPAASGGAATSRPEAQTTEQQRDAVTEPAAPAPQTGEEGGAAAPAPDGQPPASDTGEPTAQAGGEAAPQRLAALPAAQPLPAGRWQPGVHYQTLSPPQATNVARGQVEVLEVFWYGCSHCYALEPFLSSWNQNKPEYVAFAKVPVMWSPQHRAHARLFYALEALGRSDLHAQVFDEIHQRGNMLLGRDEESSLDLQAAFVKTHGVDPQAFVKAAQSFGVNSNLQRAEQIMRRYRVEGVPLLTVNGKYVTDVGRAGGQSNLLALLNDLAASERRQ